jgi:hypothetical protein
MNPVERAPADVRSRGTVVASSAVRATAAGSGRRSQVNHSVFLMPSRRRRRGSRADGGWWCTTASGR